MKGRLKPEGVRMFRVHFEDEFGTGAYDVETYEDAREEVKELRKLGCCSNIWLENLSEPEWT